MTPAVSSLALVFDRVVAKYKKCDQRSLPLPMQMQANAYSGSPFLLSELQRHLCVRKWNG